MLRRTPAKNNNIITKTESLAEMIFLLISLLLICVSWRLTELQVLGRRFIPAGRLILNRFLLLYVRGSRSSELVMRDVEVWLREFLCWFIRVLLWSDKEEPSYLFDSISDMGSAVTLMLLPTHFLHSSEDKRTCRCGRVERVLTCKKLSKRREGSTGRLLKG